MHAIAGRAIDLCRLDGGALVLDDASIDVLADLWGKAVAAGEAFDVADALLATALTLLDKPEGKPAARTLFSLVLAVQPGLQHLDQARADVVKARADAAAGAFAAFAGEEKVTRVLDSGARPAGTTAAGPLARFALVGQAHKKP
jgi:hypothetical protein